MVDLKFIEKHSPMDMVKIMCRLRTVDVDGQWRMAEVIKERGSTADKTWHKYHVIFWDFMGEMV